MANIPGVITSQTGGREFNGEHLTQYSMFVGGLNATHHALRNYSPFLSGFDRLFMVRAPWAMLNIYGGSNHQIYSPQSKFIQFKHMCEYMHKGVTGFGEKVLETAGTAVTGGFAGRSFQTPTVTKDQTTEFTLSLYEMVGCPVFDIIDTWMNAIGDENSGYSTYGGYISGGTDNEGKPKRLYARSGESDDGIEFNEANHTAEFIYVITDRSGAQVERAVLLADCFPKGITQNNVLTSEAGTHDNVTYDIAFNCVMYRSTIITAIANDLLKQYRIVTNSLNFNPELGDAVYGANDTTRFQSSLGYVPVDSATGTNIGNLPAYMAGTTPKTVISNYKPVAEGKLAGQPGREAKPSTEGFVTT